MFPTRRLVSTLLLGSALLPAKPMGRQVAKGTYVTIPETDWSTDVTKTTDALPDNAHFTPHYIQAHKWHMVHKAKDAAKDAWLLQEVHVVSDDMKIDPKSMTFEAVFWDNIYQQNASADLDFRGNRKIPTCLIDYDQNRKVTESVATLKILIAHEIGHCTQSNALPRDKLEGDADEQAAAAYGPETTKRFMLIQEQREFTENPNAHLMSKNYGRHGSWEERAVHIDEAFGDEVIPKVRHKPAKKSFTNK